MAADRYLPNRGHLSAKLAFWPLIDALIVCSNESQLAFADFRCDLIKRVT